MYDSHINSHDEASASKKKYILHHDLSQLTLSDSFDPWAQ